MHQALRIVYVRELDTLDREVALYPNDASLWKDLPGCSNTGGNLALHLVGNLRHFVGAQLGGTGYVRHREAEFSTKGLSREAVRELIASARAEVDGALKGLSEARLSEPFPIPINAVVLSNGVALTHLLSHLAFHLGQIDYHRRAVTGDRASADVLSLAALQA
jgi:hypothetical protein